MLRSRGGLKWSESLPEFPIEQQDAGLRYLGRVERYLEHSGFWTYKLALLCLSSSIYGKSGSALESGTRTR
jgi:hypothetical protein